MLDPKFYNKKGELTEYALACGYVQKTKLFRQDGTDIEIELWMEYNCLHVRAHDFSPKTKYNLMGVKGRIVWESFDDNLGEARKFFYAEIVVLEKTEDIRK